MRRLHKLVLILFLGILLCLGLVPSVKAACDQWDCHWNCFLNPVEIDYVDYMMDQICGPLLELCISAGTVYKPACIPLFECAMAKGAKCAWECEQDPCSHYPCGRDCEEWDSYEPFIYCAGDDLRTYNKFEDYYCPVGSPSFRACEHETKIIDDRKLTTCTYGCGSGGCQGPIECYADSQCGENHFIHSPECFNGDVYQDYITYTCTNPGIQASYCDYNIDYRLKQECSSGDCVAGQCGDSFSCSSIYPDYPFECNGQCWGCPDDYTLCCPYNGDPEWCCRDTGPYCNRLTGKCTDCGGDYPRECNGRCYTECSNPDSFFCCPQNGGSPVCCWNYGVCMSDGSCCYPSKEVCNNKDDDCDGIIDNHYIPCGMGACAGGQRLCTNGVFGSCSTDYLATNETCNNVDDDCDWLTDEGLSRECGTDTGACSNGTQQCSKGVWGACGAGYVAPTNETCNGVDDDCNGIIDEYNVCGDYPNVTLVSPSNNYISYIGNITFSCELRDDNGLKNISLYYTLYNSTTYGNSTLLETKDVAGTSALVTFELNNVPNATYVLWNCFAYDIDAHLSWGEGPLNLSVYYDDAPFRPILISPQGKEIINQSLTIKWVPSVDPENDLIMYYIDYSNDSGIYWFNVIENYSYVNATKTDNIKENLTFAQAGTDNIYLSLPKNSVVLNFSLNLTGYEHINMQTVDYAGDVGKFSSLALDKNNYPHISYYDMSSGLLRYARWNGSDWEKEIVDPSVSCYWTSIATDNNSYPHISYRCSNGYYTKYAYLNGSQWIIEIVENSYSPGSGSSIALDNQQIPRIIYEVNGNLIYTKWNGSEWEKEVIDTDVSGAYSSLVLDSNDYPHITYGKYNGTSSLWHAYWDGSQWVIQHVGNHYLNYKPTIDLDSNDYPIISFGSGLRLAKWNGSDWEIEILEAGDVEAASVALDNNDYPHISYHYEPLYDTNTFTYIKWNGSHWIKRDLVEGTGAVLIYSGCSLIIDSEGYPHTIFYDSRYQDLKYIRYPDIYLNYPYIDIANSGYPWEWELGAVLNHSVITHPKVTLMNEWLQMCAPNPNLYCNIPITIGSESSGIVEIERKEVNYGLTEYNWNTSNLLDGFNYKLRIKASDGMQNSSYDYSDEFVISHINDAPSAPVLLSPVGGEELDENTTISWTSSLDLDLDPVHYYIGYSQNNGYNWSNLVSEYGFIETYLDTANVSFTEPGSIIINMTLPKKGNIYSGSFSLYGDFYLSSELKPISIPSSKWIRAIDVLNRTFGFAVASSGILRWDGIKWTGVQGSPTYLQDIDIHNATLGFVVGVGGKIYKWDGNEWTEDNSPTDENLYSIAISPNGKLAFAGDEYGRIIKWNGSWYNETETANPLLNWDLSGISFVNDTFAFAVVCAQIFVWNGQQWSEFNHYTGVCFEDIDMYNSTLGFIVGRDYTGKEIMAWDGTSWSPVATQGSGDLNGVSVSKDFAYAVGWDGRIVKWNKTDWVEQARVLPSAHLFGVDIYEDILFIGGGEYPNNGVMISNLLGPLTNPSMDIFNDGFLEWNYTGELTSPNSLQNLDLNLGEINAYLLTCTPDNESKCKIPINVSSSSAGLLEIIVNNLLYNLSEYDWNLTNMSEGTRYMIRIKASDGELESEYDYSDSFTIKHIEKDKDGDNYTADVDCNDTNYFVYPGASELCNNIDDNCNNLTDENLLRTCGTDVGECCSGIELCVQGNWIGCNATLPATEIVCNGLDENCDGVDECACVIWQNKSCGEGNCPGFSTCVFGNWSYCSSYNTSCGNHCICDMNGNETYHNNAPILSPIQNITVYEGELVEIIVNATDADDDNLTYYINDSRFTQENNTFRWQTKGECVNGSCFVNSSGNVSAGVGTASASLFENMYAGNSEADIPITAYACYNDSDCGIDYWLGQEYCTGGGGENQDIADTYRTYTCHNPGTPNAYCTHTDTDMIKQDCGDTQCGNWSGPYCYQGNIWRYRECWWRGCDNYGCYQGHGFDDEKIMDCGDAGNYSIRITVSDGQLNDSQEVYIIVLPLDRDKDGYNRLEDCDDGNENIYPGALEICNGIDDDCDGAIDDNCTASFNINLKQGWNLISLPLDLRNKTLGYALSSIDNKYANVFTYINGEWLQLSDDSRVDETMGLWVNVLENVTLRINGTFIYNSSFNLSQGYNLIGYPRLSQRNVWSVFSNVLSEVENIFGYENKTWKSYKFFKIINTLDYIKPGFGYWVEVRNETSWYFDARFS